MLTREIQSINLAIQDHHLIKKNQILCLDKLGSKELCNIQLLINFLKPTSQAYFENVFAGHIFEWSKIYILPRIVTTDSRIRIFQYKILLNVLYLNKKLIEFNKIRSSECSFCKCEEETTIHLFHNCRKTQALWMQLTSHLNRHLNLPPQRAVFGFLDISNKDCLIANHLSLLFKYYIKSLMKNMKNIYNIEKDLVDQDPHKKTEFLKKWQSTECTIRQFNTRLIRTISKESDVIFHLFYFYYHIIILRLRVGNGRVNIVSLEIPFGVDSYCMESSHFICIPNQLPAFCIVLVSAEEITE